MIGRGDKAAMMEPLALRVEGKTGVRRPTETAKRIGWGMRDAKFELEYVVTTAFTAFVFVIAFFY